MTGSQDNEFINNHQQLYIKEAKDEDAGLYTCIAQNEQGTTSKNIYVNKLGELFLNSLKGDKFWI